MTTQPGVKESTTGTISEAERQAQAALEAKEKTPSDVSKVSPKDSKSYSQEEVDKLLHVFKSESGREKKELEVKVSSLEKQVKSKESEFTDNTAEIEKLEARIDDLTKDDPERFNAIKELRAAKEERKQLKADRDALEGEKATHAESIKLAYDTLREVSIWNIAGEYDEGDPVKLKDLCDTSGTASEEQIRNVADILWTKKVVEPAKSSTPPLKLFSGMTHGGAEDLSNLSPREKIELGIEKLKKK